MFKKNYFDELRFGKVYNFLFYNEKLKFNLLLIFKFH